MNRRGFLSVGAASALSWLYAARDADAQGAQVDIPFGETRSYSEIANAIGSPNSTRAVASAIAHNRVAVVIPCHRVVRQGGSLGGYRWGVERKRRLLEKEHAITEKSTS